MANLGATVLALIIIVCMTIASIFLVRGITHINLEPKEWSCTKYSEWRVYEEEQLRDCIQFTKQQQKGN